ncbi:MAG: hypothetical protein V1737_02155 [Chloroflexota bacterium]
MPACLETTREPARFVAETSYEDLPQEVVEAAKMCPIDRGGARQSTVPRERLKASALNAATINGTMGHVRG